MDIRSLIPKNKFDNETAELLKLYSYEQIKPIVPDVGMDTGYELAGFMACI